MSGSALQSRNFLVYLAGNSISLLGLWVYRVALGWFAWQLSRSELWVGIIAFTQFAPAVLFGPIFGVLADRFDRRAASLLINSISVINMFVLALLTALGSIDIYVVALLSLMQGILDGAHLPVRMAIVPNLVAKEQLRSAIATTSISFNLSRFVGPMIAGIVITSAGTATAFLFNGVSYLALIVALMGVQLNPSAETPARRADALAELREGLRYVRQNQPVRDLLLAITISSVFGRGVLEMLPAFADAVLQRGSAGLSILISGAGAGAIAAGLAYSRGAAWLNPRFIQIAVAINGLVIASLGTVDQFWVAVFAVTLLGLILSLCGIGGQILVQTLVEDQVRGRVSSIWGALVFGGTALGSLVVGWAAHSWDLQYSIIAAGILCLLLTGISAFRST